MKHMKPFKHGDKTTKGCKSAKHMELIQLKESNSYLGQTPPCSGLTLNIPSQTLHANFI